MKISYRILLTALAAVVVIFASSTLTFYSLTGKIVLGLAGAALSLVFLLFFLDRKNARSKAEYSGFLTLINQNLSLREMSDSVLAKIIKSAGLTAGRLYMIEQGGPVLLSSYGLLNETSTSGNKIDLYQRAIKKGEEAEFFFSENFPTIRSGLLELQIRYLLIMPVIYNRKVIAVLEAASVSLPKKWAREYFASIKDQLAAGLSKAYALRQLENLVQELKVNKEESKKQNTEIPPQALALPEAKTEEAEIEDEELLFTETPAPVETVPESAEQLIERRASQTILIIDPNNENRKIISRYLSSKHYSILQAESIQQGIKEISMKKPFAVTLSLSASGLASWDMLKGLKQNADTANLPVILYNTVDPLNFGYGLQVYDYVFGRLSAEVIKTYAEKFANVKNIVCAGFEDKAAGIKDLKGVKVTFVQEQNAAFKSISKLQPELVFIDAFMHKGDGISLVDRLKTSFETKDLPVVLCLGPEAGKEDLALLQSSIEKAAIRSKGHRIDILKAIRNRIHIEEGIPEEDTSSILIEESEPEEAESTDATGEKKLPSNKVLIVDDDTEMLSEVQDIVNKSGCETAVAKSGLECLTALRTFKPDLILLDIMMPQMDGFETIKRIKAERNFKDIPVFALTAHEMIDEKEILIRNGFDDFVSKPVDSGSLSFKIEKVLNNIAEF